MHYDPQLRAQALSSIVEAASFSCIGSSVSLSVKRGRNSGWEADGGIAVNLVLSENPFTTGRKKVERETREGR